MKPQTKMTEDNMMQVVEEMRGVVYLHARPTAEGKLQQVPAVVL